MKRISGSHNEPLRATVQSIDRAVRMLQAFTTEEPELGLTRLAAVIGLSKGTTYRIASTLIDGGLMEQDPILKTYRVGLGALSLAEVARSGPELTKKAFPHLEQLRNRSGETVYLLLNRDGCVVCVERLEGTHRMRHVATPPGSSVPYTRGAGGTAMLAAMSEQDANRLLGPDAGADVLARVETARERGYAFAQGDISDGIGAIAVALVDRSSTVVGAISLGGLLPRVIAAETEIVESIRATVRGISADMRWWIP